MFVARHVKETFTDPVTAVCEIGKFDGPRTRFGDIVFMREGIEHTKTFMNSDVLREILLSNPRLFEQCVGVKIVDINEWNEMAKKIDDLEKKLKKVNLELEARKKGKVKDLFDGGVQ